MHTLSVIGPGSIDVIDAVADRLDGRVAVIEWSSDSENTAVEDTRYMVHADGTWSGQGEKTTLDRLLDQLSTTHEYALLSGTTRARVPTIVIGDKTAIESGTVIETVPDADSVDSSAVAESIKEYEPYITLATLIEQVKATPGAERSGAIATFTGRVRAKDSDDDSPTESLTFEKYDGVAEARMEKIESELAAREGVFSVTMHHRVGRIEDGEDIVFVVVLAGHRTEAFRTVEDGINRLKDEVPIFKKEVTTDEEFWVHDRSS